MDKCRICLEYKKNLCSVFDEDHGISYANMLTSIAKVKIIEDAYENRICLQCRRKLRSLYNFKIEIERSDLKLNQQFKIFMFDNINDVKSHLKEMRDCKQNVTIDRNVNYISLLDSHNGTMVYRNTTIRKFDFHNNYSEVTHEVTSGLELEANEYETDNFNENLYADLDTYDYKAHKRKRGRPKKMKEKDEVLDAKKDARLKSTFKKVCIKPILLENIRIIPEKSKRKLGKAHKGYKRQKRLDMCPQCGIMTTNVKSHILVHIGEKKYKCSECNKAFFKSSSLSQHLNKHLMDEAFKCDHCVAVFNNKMALQSHIILHTDDKSFVCSICNKAFKRRATLLRHKLIHNSLAKSEKCELCNRSFLYKYALRHHMRVHTGERPFKCEICSQPYSYKHDFNRHCLKKHGIFLKHRSVHVMNEEVLMQERAVMKDLMLKVQGVVKEGERLNPFKGPKAALAFNEAVKALGSCQIPIDVML